MIIKPKRMLNRIVAIYPDGLVVANGVDGVYISRNLAKTWNKVMSYGRIDKLVRLADKTFVYEMHDLPGIIKEDMITYDAFQSNALSNQTWWYNIMKCDSTVDPEIFYIPYIHYAGGQNKLHITKTSKAAYVNTIWVDWPEKEDFDIDNISSIKYFNVIRNEQTNRDNCVITSGNTTYVVDPKTKQIINQYDTFNKFVTSDGTSIITDIEDNDIIKNCLSVQDTERVLFNYFPTGYKINKIERINKDLYIHYNDPNFTIIKYNTKKKSASLFFQLRNMNGVPINNVKPGIPQFTKPSVFIH